MHSMAFNNRLKKYTHIAQVSVYQMEKNDLFQICINCTHGIVPKIQTF